ncbi:hypothetical protein [Streptomyces sp. NPDC097619]|uniref:hypothetical protein n=1 Tax=Streptomyces sp. NPDC097619 TaxID=3157228 RepID=UPI00332F68B1
MSTTTSSADPGRRPLRERLARPFRRRPGGPAGGTARAAGTAGGPGVRRIPVAVPARQERRLRTTSTRLGRRAAKSGALDPWVLASGQRVPYFAELAAVRDHLSARLVEDAAREEERERSRRGLAVSGAATSEAEVGRLDGELRAVRRSRASTEEQLNRLAARAVRWEEFRDGVRARIEERWLRTRFGDPGGDGSSTGPAEGPAVADDAAHGEEGGDGEDGSGARGRSTDPTVSGVPLGEGWQELGHPPASDRDGSGDRTTRTAPGSADGADAFAGVRMQVDAARWEGLRARPGLPAWMVYGLLLVVAAVEVPIYWIAFQPFHGTGSAEADSLSGTLAVSAALVMVVVPHLAGRALRSRAATGAARLVSAPALALIAVWAWATWALGDLRSKLVFREDSVPDTGPDLADVPGLSGSTPSLVDSLHLEPTTVTWMFMSLLLLSGGIGLLLGLLREHPYLDAYRSALEREAELTRARDTAAEVAGRLRALEDTAPDQRELRAAVLRARQQAVADLYESAAGAYLQGLIEKAGDPAVTEAAMRLAEQRPLLRLPAAR